MDLIIGEGYPLETHYVTTEDGYILELLRIPYNARDNVNYRTPVIVSHGMFGTAVDWVRYLKKDSLRKFITSLTYI